MGCAPATPEVDRAIKAALIAYIDFIAADPLRHVPLLNAGHCGICGKALTDPESMAAGIGPECIKMFSLLVEVAHAQADAVLADIKELRRKMQQAHPDHGGDPAEFIEIRKEFERLKKSQREAA